MQLPPLLHNFLLKDFFYPNDASKLVVVAGNVERRESR
jgi:hypothetical protein